MNGNPIHDSPDLFQEMLPSSEITSAPAKICPVCEKEITDPHRKKYCSDGCSKKAGRKKERKSDENLVEAMTLDFKNGLIEEWKQGYHTAEDPSWKGNKAAWIQFAKIATHFDAAEIRRRWRLYLQETSDFFKGHPLTKFCSQFDRWAKKGTPGASAVFKGPVQNWEDWSEKTLAAEHAALAARLKEK